MKRTMLVVLLGLRLQASTAVVHAAEQVTLENARLSVTLASEASRTVVSLRDVVTGGNILAPQSVS